MEPLMVPSLLVVLWTVLCLINTTVISEVLTNTQDIVEQDKLQDELLSLLVARAQEGGGVPEKRASHGGGKGPAPVTRVLNQVKLSKLADRRRNKDRGGHKNPAHIDTTDEWDEDEEEEEEDLESTSPASVTRGEEVSRSAPSTRTKGIETGRLRGGSTPPPPHHPKPTPTPNPVPSTEPPPPPPLLTYATLTPQHLRLQKLDFYFAQLAVFSEDCRKRLLCEVAENTAAFQPLSFVLQEETSFAGEYQHVTSEMMNTTAGARLLSYMEATLHGQDRTRGCGVFQYRCPSTAKEMLNMEALVLWREMIRWLTVQVARRAP